MRMTRSVESPVGRRQCPSKSFLVTRPDFADKEFSNAIMQPIDLILHYLVIFHVALEQNRNSVHQVAFLHHLHGECRLSALKSTKLLVLFARDGQRETEIKDSEATVGILLVEYFCISIKPKWKALPGDACY